MLTGKQIIWDTDKPSGDRLRIMDTTRAKNYGIFAETSLEDGIAETLEWYKNNSDLASARYNSFTEKELLPDA